MITKLLVVKQHPDGGLIKIYDEEWFYAIRAEERRAGPAFSGRATGTSEFIRGHRRRVRHYPRDRFKNVARVEDVGRPAGSRESNAAWESSSADKRWACLPPSPAKRDSLSGGGAKLPHGL